MSMTEASAMASRNGGRPTWLLLLPNPPSDISMSALRTAYGPGLTQALKLASKKSTESSRLVLDIAVSCEHSSIYGYTSLQRLFGMMYKLICVICTEEQIDLQYGNDVDARLTIFQGNLGANESQDKEETNSSSSQRSFIDLESLAKTERAWQRICSMEGENAERLLQGFLQTRNSSSQNVISESQIERLPGGLAVHQNPPQVSRAPSDFVRYHDSVAVGGTFDHLHAGHKLLLTMTALLIDPEASGPTFLTIGITGDDLLKNKQYRDQLEDFHDRQSTVQFFLLGILELISPKHVLIEAQNNERSKPFGREVQNTLRSGLTIKYVEIFDPCGPTITDEAISALVLSAETRSGGQAVNDKRKEKGWPALDVFEVDVLGAGEGENGPIDDKFQSKISSTDIRRRVHQTATANGKL